MTMTNNISLSDAIRLGAMAKPQAFYGPDPTMRLADYPAMCAIAAAAFAVGADYLTYKDEYERWPILSNYNVSCPACGELHVHRMMGVIWVLNDLHQWSRERIADFVASHEAAEVARTAVAVDPHVEVLESCPRA